MIDSYADRIANEARMRGLGIRRYLVKQAKAIRGGRLTQVGAGESLLAAMLPALESEIKKLMDGRRRGRPSAAVALLKKTKIKPDILSSLTARTVHDSVILHKDAVTSTVFRIGRRVEDQARLQRFKYFASKSFADSMKDTKELLSYSYRRKIMFQRETRTQMIPKWVPWTTVELGAVGKKLLEAMEVSTGSIYICPNPNKRNALTIRPTPEFTAALINQTKRSEGLRPFFLPLKEKPVPWRSAHGGGYLGFDYPLVKTWATQGDANEDPSETILSSINAIQETAWRVNVDVLKTVNEMWNSPHIEMPAIPLRENDPEPQRPKAIGATAKKLSKKKPLVIMNDIELKTTSQIFISPFHNNEPAPERPKEIGKSAKSLPKKDMNSSQLKALRIYNGTRMTWFRQKVVHDSKLLASAQIKGAADQYVNEDKIFFPHHLDWRGRIYAVPPFLNPQGPDFARGLLEFAEGKMFGTPEAADAFMICGATHYGIDKCNFRERIKWVKDNETAILDVASDPLSNSKFWADAEEPYQFLAWCLEYSNWVDVNFSLDFISHKVVGLDGSINGIQHFSALLRDPVAARAVNLISSDEPRDLYQEVADEVIIRLKKEGQGTDENARLARMWVNSKLINRKACKKQIMTVPYSSTSWGQFLMLQEYLEKLEEEGIILPFDNLFNAINFLNPRIHDVISTKVDSAHKVMAWLKLCVEIKADHNRGTHWTCPSGFRVSQTYKTTKQGRIHTHLAGSARRLSYLKDTDIIHKGKQKSAAAANLIHSLDASHLMATVQAMTEQMKLQGKSVSWAVVHDSFGSHAADAPLLAKTLREEFVKMYSEHDPLADFKAENQKQFPEILPDPPRKGNLDINEVLDSYYFFA